MDFYVTGGAGIYSQVTTYRALTESFRQPGREFEVVSTNYVYKPGVNAGAGFAFRVGDFSNLKVFAEARYHRMFIGPSDVSFVPVTVGVRF